MTICDKKISNHDLLNHDLILYFLFNIRKSKKPRHYNLGFFMVETVGIEPMTSTLPVWRSPS